MKFRRGSTNTFDPVRDVPDLSGKVYIVTGGSAGIGFGIAAHILEHKPAKLYILSSTEERLCHAYAELKQYGRVSSTVEPIQCDFNNLRQTDQVAKRLATEITRLDALILNAGLGVGLFGLSKNGIDTHMQVNVIAQHHLMNVLLPKLVSTDDSRIIFQSSEFHRYNTGGIEFANLEEINRDVGASKLYARSKLAQVLIARALLQRKNRSELGMTPSKAPWILACHPGGVVTDQQDQAVEAYGFLGKLGVKAARTVMKDPISEGCRSALYAATSAEISSGELDGAYIVPDKKVSEVSDQAKDSELGERCWSLVEEIIEQKLAKRPSMSSITD